MKEKKGKEFSKLIIDSRYRNYVLTRKFGCLINDKEAIDNLFFYFMKYKMDMANPKTLNEKLQWLKLYDRNPLYITLVDKHSVKNYVSELIGEEYVIPTIGLYNEFDEIDFKSMPKSFVIKCTHDSGSIVICRDKNTFDIKSAKKYINKKIKRNYYWVAREWPYKNVKPKILIEKYIEDSNGELLDYKFYCFNGKPFVVLVCVDRQIGKTKYYFFDRNWELKRFNKNGMEAPKNFAIKKPKNIDKMFSLSEKLATSTNAPFVRIDLYSIGDKIYFGEFTFYPNAGFDTNRLPEIDRLFGDMVKLKK